MYTMFTEYYKYIIYTESYENEIYTYNAEFGPKNQFNALDDDNVENHQITKI